MFCLVYGSFNRARDKCNSDGKLRKASHPKAGHKEPAAVPTAVMHRYAGHAGTRFLTLKCTLEVATQAKAGVARASRQEGATAAEMAAGKRRRCPAWYCTDLLAHGRNRLAN